jgi:hypothetical protein
MRAVAVLVDLSARIASQDEEERDELSADEKDILDAFKARQQRVAAEPGAAPASDTHQNASSNSTSNPNPNPNPNSRSGTDAT